MVKMYVITTIFLRWYVRNVGLSFRNFKPRQIGRGHRAYNVCISFVGLHYMCLRITLYYSYYKVLKVLEWLFANVSVGVDVSWQAVGNILGIDLGSGTKYSWTKYFWTKYCKAKYRKGEIQIRQNEDECPIAFSPYVHILSIWSICILPNL